MATTSLPLDHSGLGILTEQECLDRLRTARVGRLAFIDHGEPMILPINHGLDRSDVVFRTAEGSKQIMADDGLPVAFEVDAFDTDRRTGWSVVVRGVARTVEDQAEIARLSVLGVWPYADMVERFHWVRISTTSLTGRLVVHPAW